MNLILACGSMGSLSYVLLTGFIFLVVGSVLWLVNLCLSLTLDGPVQQIRHFVFALSCLGAAVIAGVSLESLGFLAAVIGAHAVPIVVMAHFAYLLTLRRRQRERAIDPARRLNLR